MLQNDEDIERIDKEIIATIPDARRYPELDAPGDRQTFWRAVNGLLRSCNHHHVCSAAKCLKDGTCARGFPQAACQTTYVDSVLNRVQYMRLELADQYIVNYHPGLVFILQCHVHLQRGTAAVWVNYLLKYQMKVDTHGYIRIDASTLHCFGLGEEVSAGVMQACAATLHAKIVSVNEAAWVLQGLPLVIECDAIEYKTINLSAPMNRTLAYGGAQNSMHITDTYFNRPMQCREIADCTLVQYNTVYEFKAASTSNAEEREKYVCTRDDGKHIFTLDNPLCPVLQTYGPDKGEDFYYSELMQLQAWQSNAEVLHSDTNVTKTFCEAAYLHGLFPDDASLVTHLSQTKYQWEGKARDNALEFVASEAPIATMLAMRAAGQAVLNHTASELAGMTPEALSRFFHSTIQREYAGLEAQSIIDAREQQCMADPDQAAVLAILNHPTQRLFRVQGPGGTGKTHVLRALISKAVASGKRVIVCATTAKAARIVGCSAQTAHYAFGFMGATWIPITNTHMLMYISMANMIVLDEVSMAQASFLQEVHQRCLDASSGSTEPFAGKMVVLSGDKHQLPAVCSIRTCKEATCPHQPYRWPMWGKFTELMLNTNHRQNPNNMAWIDCLNFVLEHPPNATHLALLQSRVLPVGHTYSPPVDAIHIAGRNDEVNMYNAERGELHFPDQQLQTIDAVDTVQRGHRFTAADLEFLHKKMDEKGILPKSLTLAIGMLVKVTKNMKSPRVENGSVGEVVSISPSSIELRMLGSQSTVKISKQTEKKFKSGVSLTRTMFPLTPGFARTVHKVQGDTITTDVIIDFSHMDRLGQAYVALSRVVDINHLYILPAGIVLTADMFSPHVPHDGPGDVDAAPNALEDDGALGDEEEGELDGDLAL